MKIFKNPVFVGILAVIALAVVFNNIIKPIFFKGGGKQAVKNVRNSKPAVAKEKAVKPEAVQGKIDYDNVGWAESFVRDPFKLEALAEELARVEEAEKKRTRRIDTLTAVIVEPGVRLAVINNKIVGLGESYFEFKVLRISSGMVLLEGPEGNKKLTFN